MTAKSLAQCKWEAKSYQANNGRWVWKIYTKDRPGLDIRLLSNNKGKIMESEARENLEKFMKRNGWRNWKWMD